MVEGIQYGGGISSIRWKIFSTDMSHHQYSGGHAIWASCHMINTEKGVQYMDTDTAQKVVGGCIYPGKWYFTDNITQISSCCDESKCS